MHCEQKLFDKILKAKIRTFDVRKGRWGRVTWWSPDDWKYYVEDSADKNNDGTLTREEIRSKYEEYVQNVFKIFDKNVDDGISLNELGNPSIDFQATTGIADIMVDSFPLKYWIKHLLFSNSVFDQNQDGYCSRTELETSILFYLRMYSDGPLHTDLVMDIYDYLVINNDGKVYPADIQYFAKDTSSPFNMSHHL